MGSGRRLSDFQAPSPFSLAGLDPAALAGRVAAARRAAGLSVSVCLPARDEEATVGEIVRRIRAELMDGCPVVDEIVVVDDHSRDATAATARAAGATVVAAQQVLADFGANGGKGAALWKSLFASRGDLVCWLDADVTGFEPRFVTDLVAPLVLDPAIVFVKGHYARPQQSPGVGGGRVTELVARPLLSRFLPHLAVFPQPLSGEYSGRRHVLEQLPFAAGWGVDVALLADVVAAAGIERVAMADLGVRHHKHRPRHELGLQAATVMLTVLDRAGLADVEPEWRGLLRPAPPSDGAPVKLDVVPIELAWLPPLCQLPGRGSGSGVVAGPAPGR